MITAPPWESLSKRTLLVWNLSLILVLSLPVMAWHFHWVAKAEAFKVVPRTESYFPYLYRQIYQENSDIDLVFMGQSSMWAGINSAYVEEKLSKTLHRPAKVITLAWNYYGADLGVLLLRELTRHRKVKEVVWSLPAEREDQGGPHSLAAYFMQFGDGNFLSEGLPFRHQAQYFAESLVATPRQLLERLFPRTWEPDLQLITNHGAWVNPSGFVGEPFVPSHFPAPTFTARQMTYSPETVSQFSFTNDPLLAFDEHFFHRFVDIAQKNNVKVAILNIPRWNYAKLDTVRERRNWVKYFNTPVALIGIAPTRLFSHLSAAQIKGLYYDGMHLNANGNRFFTEAITPAIMATFVQNESRNELP